MRCICVSRHAWQAKGSAKARMAIRGWETGAAGAGTHEAQGHGAVEETVAVSGPPKVAEPMTSTARRAKAKGSSPRAFGTPCIHEHARGERLMGQK